MVDDPHFVETTTTFLILAQTLVLVLRYLKFQNFIGIRHGHKCSHIISLLTEIDQKQNLTWLIKARAEIAHSYFNQVIHQRETLCETLQVKTCCTLELEQT